MKSLNAAILSALFVKYVTATAFSEIKLADVMSDDLETAVKLYEQYLHLQDEITIHVIKTKQPSFAVDFVRQTKRVNGFTLAALYENGSEATIERVHDEIEFSQNDLINAASEPGLVCQPQKYIALLDKITTSKGQESAVELGIQELFIEERTNCINPLLSVLRGKEFLSERLEDIAIQTAFKSGAKTRNVLMVKTFYAHPAITPGVYADVLLVPGMLNSLDPFSVRLLRAADRDDLQAVRDKYGGKSSDFRRVIKKAFATAEPGGNRLTSLERAKLAKKIFSVRTGTSLTAPGPGDIIGSYLIGMEK